MRKNRVFLRLLVLCVCVGGRIALEQETRTPDANEQGKLSPSPIAGHNWKYPRDQHQQQQSRQPRLLQMQHHSLSSDESTFRRPFDSNYLHSAEFDEEEAAASSNDVRNHNNIEPGQLNVHEAQLARLHGLGPAEIAALYNWQQRMRIPPIFASRNPPVATKRKSDPALNNPANLANDTQTPTWPKRSALVEMKKPEKEAGKSRGQGYSRKAEQSGKAGKQGGKSARRQQSQESVPHFDGPATNKGKDASPYEQHANRAPPPDVSRINRNLATQFLLRSPRENRQYDVPIIECPPAEDGMERFACPTPDIVGRYRCIDDHVLCDGFIDCPGGEDEDGQACMFYKTMKAHLDLVADALLRWVRGR